jgi:hypothetical protein
MAATDPIQQMNEDIRSLQSSIGDLQEHVRLSTVQEEVSDLDTTLTGLGQRLASLRTRGYVFGKDLENQARGLVSSWAPLFPNLQAQINTQSAALVNALRPIEMQMPQLNAAAGNPGAARVLLNTLRSETSMLEDKASAAEKSINSMYEQLGSQVALFSSQLDQVEYMLTQLAEAKFQLLPTEGGIAAVKAVWCKSGKEEKDDPQGVLYLTDQRLLFEQKEEIVTKKVLFVATEKKMVQELLLECPVSLVESVDASKQGLLKNEDHIGMNFGSGAPLSLAHFHIWADCSTWQMSINRAKSKFYDGDRAVPIDQAAVDKVKAAPAQCPSCGGNINKPVLRGQDSLTCEYCGFVIRL